MHGNYYLTAYCYYRSGQDEDMLTYLIRGSIFSPESLKKEEQENTPFHNDTHFLEQAKAVFMKIENGEINPMKYLQD